MEDWNIRFVFQVGMRNYHLRRSSVYCKAINVDQLFTLIPEETRLKYANKKDKAVVIDVVKKVHFIFWISLFKHIINVSLWIPAWVI